VALAVVCSLLQNLKALMVALNILLMRQQRLSSQIKSALSFAQILIWAVLTLPVAKYRFVTGTQIKLVAISLVVKIS